MIELYKYQKEYLAELPARCFMAADTGTGKTFMSLAHYQKHGEGRPLLILAPASKIRTGDWERDITEFFGKGNEPKYHIYSYEKFSREPTMKQRLAGKKDVWRQFSPYHSGCEPYAIIADEAHRAKNSQSGIGKTLYYCAKDAPFFVGLTATPLPNGWIDFANYSKIFGFTKNITEFKKKYCNIQRYKGFPEIVNYWHEDQMTRQWNSISKKLAKADALDLPTKTIIGVDFKKPSEYVRLLVQRTDNEGEPIDNPSALAHACRQSLIKGKLAYLSTLLDGTNENIVIFYNYISEREAILELISKKHKDKVVFRQDGEKHELPKKENWSNINNSITLAHYKSGSTGVEMTYASIVIYVSPTYSYAEYIQSIGRVFRNGQIKKTTFYLFRTKNSIEAEIYDCLKDKQDFQVKQWGENNEKKT